MRLCIYHQFDPEASAAGGIGKFLLNLIKDIPEDWEIILICCTSKKKIDSNSNSIFLNGRLVKLVYVLTLNDENKRKIFPITISYLKGLFLNRKLIPDGDIHFIQRLEYSILFKFLPFKGKKIMLFHNDYQHILDASKSESYWAHIPKIYMCFVDFFTRNLDLILSVNSNTKKLINNHLGKSVVDVIPTWPNRSIFKVIDEKDIEEFKIKFTNSCPELLNKKIILFVGRLQNQKNPFLALDLISLIEEEYHLVMIGDGNLKNDLTSYATKKGISNRVTFYGNVEQTDLVYLYNLSNLYLSTSHFEGMSVALLEALSCGLPALTTPTGESNLIIEKCKNGIVTNDHTLNSLYDAFVTIKNHKFSKLEILNSIKKYDSEPLISKFKKISPYSRNSQ